MALAIRQQAGHHSDEFPLRIGSPQPTQWPRWAARSAGVSDSTGSIRGSDPVPASACSINSAPRCLAVGDTIALTAAARPLLAIAAPALAIAAPRHYSTSAAAASATAASRATVSEIAWLSVVELAGISNLRTDDALLG